MELTPEDIAVMDNVESQIISLETVAMMGQQQKPLTGTTFNVSGAPRQLALIEARHTSSSFAAAEAAAADALIDAEMRVEAVSASLTLG